MLQEVPLQFGHGELFLREALGKIIGKLLLLREEFEEQTLDHGEGGIAQFDVHVAAAWSEQCWIELFFVIRGHKQDTTLLSSNTIQGIQ